MTEEHSVISLPIIETISGKPGEDGSRGPWIELLVLVML